MSLETLFAKNIQERRLKKKWSQHDLADKVKCSVSYVSMLEHGKRAPTLDTIARFAKAFRVTAVDMLK